MSYPNLSLKTTHIGSLPFTEKAKALEIAFSFDIPAWPQLPKFKEEGMLWQFVTDFPGFSLEKEIIFTNTPDFDERALKIYEIYLEIRENQNFEPLIHNFDFSFSKAFLPFIKEAEKKKPIVVKGQITGPFTLGIALKTDTQEILIFRDDLRDLLLKFLTLKALLQVYYLKKITPHVILFFDEPGLSGFGSSAYITLSKDFTIELLKEPIEVLNSYNVLTGVHVCANTSWDLLFEAGVNLVNLDSFSYFEKFMIFAEKIKDFLSRENTYLAFGAVPTDKETLLKTSEKEVIEKFERQLLELSKITSLDVTFLLQRILFTPACGMGSLNEELVSKVLFLINKLKSYFTGE